MNRRSVFVVWFVLIVFWVVLHPNTLYSKSSYSYKEMTYSIYGATVTSSIDCVNGSGTVYHTIVSTERMTQTHTYIVNIRSWYISTVVTPYGQARMRGDMVYWNSHETGDIVTVFGFDGACLSTIPEVEYNGISMDVPVDPKKYVYMPMIIKG